MTVLVARPELGDEMRAQPAGEAAQGGGGRRLDIGGQRALHELADLAPPGRRGEDGEGESGERVALLSLGAAHDLLKPYPVFGAGGDPSRIRVGQMADYHLQNRALEQLRGDGGLGVEVGEAEHEKLEEEFPVGGFRRGDGRFPGRFRLELGEEFADQLLDRVGPRVKDRRRLRLQGQRGRSLARRASGLGSCGADGRQVVIDLDGLFQILVRLDAPILE